MVPGKLGDVDQSIYAFEVYEGPEVHQVRDYAMYDLTLFEVGEYLFALFLAFLLKHRPAGEDDVVAGTVQLDNLALQALSEERVKVPHATDVHQRSR